MKAIKLLIAFCVVIAVIVGVFFVMGGGGGSARDDGSDPTLNGYRAKIENDWKQRADWDETMFRTHADMLNQLGTEYSVETLVDLDTRLAIETVYGRLVAEWASPACRRTTVDGYMKALATIASVNANANDDNNVRKLRAIDKVYRTALALSAARLGIATGFDGDTWRSFSDYSASVRARRDAVLGNALYKEFLSGISALKDGLLSIDARLAAAKASFCRELVRDIIAYYYEYDPQERNSSQLAALRSVRNRYAAEFGSSSEIDSFVKDFYRDVYNNDK